MFKNENFNKAETPQLNIGAVSSSVSFNNETKHRIFIDKMIYEISELANDIFHPEKDPEVLWKIFREQLRYLKVEHLESYNKYLETDAD